MKLIQRPILLLLKALNRHTIYTKMFPVDALQPSNCVLPLAACCMQLLRRVRCACLTYGLARPVAEHLAASFCKAVQFHWSKYLSFGWYTAATSNQRPADMLAGPRSSRPQSPTHHPHITHNHSTRGPLID